MLPISRLWGQRKVGSRLRPAINENELARRMDGAMVT
jgi:hypothetical protein